MIKVKFFKTSLIASTHGQGGGWVGVGYSYPDVFKTTPLVTLLQTPSNRDNFEVSKANPP